MASAPIAHTPARVAVPDALKARANGIIQKFNSNTAERGLNHAYPYAIGVGTLVLATAADGFGEGMGWHYPAFMQETFFGKIDWRLYGGGLAVAAYFLESDTEYEAYQEHTAALAVGLFGSYAMTKLWDGPRSWGEKLAGYVAKTTGKGGAAATAKAAGSPVLLADGTQKKSADGKALVYGADGKSEVVAAGFGDNVEVAESGRLGDTILTPEGRRLKRLSQRLDNVQAREARLKAQIAATAPAASPRQRLLPAAGPVARPLGGGANARGWKRTADGGVYIPPTSAYAAQFRA